MRKGSIGAFILALLIFGGLFTCFLCTEVM